ncbi:hypothetical protein HYW73_02130 [Candidatus Nomurabacteria bacterium]|nr:hypothetical protein [Candidatus Nomurabacteria bacterium]
MIEENNKRFYFILVGVLIAGNIFFGLNYYNTLQELQTVKNSPAGTDVNGKILDFTAMFVKEVLQAEGEVDFETRLRLENAVRDLKDAEIMAEWQKFVASQTEKEAQDSVKRLLGILVEKIQK